MVEVNSGISYLGSEIRKWCQSDDGHDAKVVAAKYYAGTREPNDTAYYFLEKAGTKASEYRVVRDIERSPRRF